jgi:hypothetical protein
LRFGTFQVKLPEDFQFVHHGSENLNQIFSTDSSIHLKEKFISSKLLKVKTKMKMK